MKNRNKKNKLHLPTKMHKRIIAGITAFAVIMTNLSIGPFYEIGEKLFGTVMSVEAADTYAEWVVEGDEYNISSTDDLAKYSSAYRYDEVNDPTGVGHSKDTLVINLTTGTDISENADIVSPFYSIGQVKPFRGTIILNGISNNYINIDKALFDQIGEETVIKIEGSEAARELVINRSAPSSDPIFAKKVVTKEEGATTSGSTLGWVIKSKILLDTGNPIDSQTAGLIGEIESGCNVKVSFTDERCMEVSSSTGDVGYICGTLGANANLEVSSFSASNNVTVTASGTEHDAGAIVGSMGDGSTLTLPVTMESFPVTSVTASGSNSYAGGLVGNNNGGSVFFSSTRESDSKYTVNQIISGKKGSGGLFGYYSPKLTDGAASLSYDDYLINCSLNGEGSSGGLFGVLYNSGNVTISDGTSNTDHIQVNNANTTTNFGGLIGAYSTSALSNTLTLINCYSKPGQSGKSTYYGGAIGTVGSASYVRLNSFSTTAAGAANFGGTVGNADGAFIDVNGLKVSANADFSGGGVVNALENGVLRMQGTIDLSGAKSGGGQIINSRNSGFAFFDEAGWTLKRSTTAAGVDDVVSWGEVVRFGSTLTQGDVLDNFTDGDHTVALKSAVTTMESTADFARTALNIQHNTGEITSGVMTFSGSGSSTLLGTNLSLSTSLAAPLSLSGTGIQGLTRDNDSQVYTATFDGKGKTLNLAIGEAYGNRGESSVAANTAGCGRIYKHTNIGLFSKTNGATIQNVTLAGDIYVSFSVDKQSQYVGAVVAENVGGFTAYGVTIDTAMYHSGSGQILIGGLLGKSTSGNITIGGSGNITDTSVPKACTVNANITGSNSGANTCIGGVVGLINQDSFEANISNVTIKGSITNTSEKDKQKLGGLIAYIQENTGTSRTLNIDTITVDDLAITGKVKAEGSLGGFLGYAWYDTTVTLGGTTAATAVTVKQTTTGKTLLTANGTATNVDMAGLVYAGTGKWTVNTVDIPFIKTAASSVRSFGMMLNVGWHETNNGAAVYLVLPDMSKYTLGISGTALSKTTNFPNFTNTTVFDELVAYSAKYDESRNSKVLENGQGIVSIRTRGNISTVNNVMKTNTCNTYQNQVTGVNMGNPNTRYYYDLDLLLAKTSDSLTSSDKLMLWSLNQYAHSSLTGTGKPFNYNPFSNNVIAPTGSETFDMDGYSYYPVDVSGATIKGTFKLYNQAIETGEAASPTPTDGYARTTLVDSVSAFSTNPYTQHHLMQNGIFLNVSGNVTVNGVLKLQGTIGADTYDNTGSGVLICGTFKGDSDHTYTFDSAEGSIVLDGIYVHNLVGENSVQLTYAPLLINKIDSYTITNLNDVSNTDYSVSGNTGYPDGKLAATSLIGKAGKKTSDETSQYIKFKFTKIKLDGRDTAISDNTGNSALTATYHTTRSIFTRATLLEEYVYTGGGSQAEYNFKHSEDWGGSGERAVTYGKEISYTIGTGEYGGEEQRYSKEDNAAEGTNPYFTRPDKDPSVEANSANSLYTAFATEFLPYVKAGYVIADNKHQIKVNHGTPVLSGCGTYNDPYVITSGDQLVMFANILNNSHSSAALYIPINDTERNNKWHGTNGCQLYSYNESTNKYATTTNKTLKLSEVMNYVASAYYKFEGDFDIPASFIGLGSAATNNINYVFHGVIDGNGSIITNKSQFPLILNSSGAVIRNLTIKVEAESDISPYIRISNNNPQNFGTINASLEAYGAIIGRVYGGDNILEHVSVDYSSFSNNIKLSNKYAKDTPVGGYIGVVIAGSVIFKDMTSVSATSKNGIPGTKVVYDDGAGNLTNNLTTNENWLYVNPIIGRVISGYAVTESNAYRPFEDGTRSDSSDNIYCYWVNGNATATEPTNPSSIDRVTMHNGTKNYSIPDIVKETKVGNVTTAYPMLRIGAYGDVTGVTTDTNLTQKTTVTFPNAQSLFILSCLTQSGVTSSATTSYSSSNTNIVSYQETYRPSRLANYNHIGQMASDGSVITNTASYEGYDDYLIAKDVSTINPYLVENYVADGTISGVTYSRANIFRLTNVNTVCDIGFDQEADASTAWVLPDGFRGLGSIAFGSTSGDQIKNMTLSVNKFSGLIGSSVVNIDLNMNLKHYDKDFDNYLPAYRNDNSEANRYSTGFGLFNTIRHNRTEQTPSGVVPTTLEGRNDDDSDDEYKISYLDITGKINYDVVHNTGSMVYNRTNVWQGNRYYLNVGGLAGFSGFIGDENLNVEHIGIDGLTVNGFKTAGGLFGFIYMGNSSDHLATITNIDTENLTVTTKLYAGGIIGYANQLGMTIDEVTISNPTIYTYYKGGLGKTDDYENGTAGIVGCVKNAANNRPITVSNVTIGDRNAASNSRIGYPSTDTPIDNDSNNRIASAGIIGESNTDSSSFISSGQYSIIIDHCYVYNVDFYGNRVAGILAHDGYAESGPGNSTIRISNVEVKSSLGAKIQGLLYSSADKKNRGCGGIAGYIKLNSNKYVLFDHCTVEGYTLSSYNDTGGICANLQNTGNAKLQNIKLSNLKYESNYAGGAFGYLQVALTGFNIQTNNLQYKKFDSNKGYLRDSNALLICKNYNSKVSLVGVTWQNNGETDLGYEFFDRVTSVDKDNKKNTNCYGTGGYIVFADYKGASTTEQINDWFVEEYEEPVFDNSNVQTGTETKYQLSEYNTFSPINQYNATNGVSGSQNVAITSQDSVSLPKTISTIVDGNTVIKAVSDLQGNKVYYNYYYDIAQNFPFVTSSSSVDIGVNSVGTDETGAARNHMQFLTSDGLSGKGTTGFSYTNTAAHAILTDLGATTKPKKYYNQLSSVLTSSSAITTFDELISSKYSTFKDVTGTDYPAFMKQNNLDFPVLILDNNEPVALTDMLNKYLQTLTNTNYNYAANNNSSIFDLKLAKCEFDTNKFIVTYNEETTDTDNSSLYTRNGNFTFNIGNVDSGNAQFTLIDVEFYDPSGTGAVAYHLYVPVYVSQMLVYDLQISSKSGSTYKLDQYTAERGNYTLENLGTPITIEARYIYQRELSDWLQAANNGEKIYRSAPKIWDIDDQTDKGFPADTKMVLVDPNRGNKAYYSTLTGQQVYGTVEEGQSNPYVTDQTAVNSEVSRLYLNKFVDSDGNAFTARKYNDYLDFTATVSNSTAGTFVPASESDATVVAKVNGVATLMKPKTDETTGTFYVLKSVAYSSAAQTYTSGTKTYLMEDYYVTLFTESSDTENMYHLGFRAPTSLGDTYPSRYTRLANGSTVRQITYVLIGNLFSFEDAALTTTIREGVGGSEQGTREVDIASAIEVEVTNKIYLTSGMFANKSFLSRQSVHIYQSFLLSLNKQTSETQTHRGIDAEPAVTMQEYTVGSYNVLGDTGNEYYTLYHQTTPDYDSNYIYLYNGKDLRTSLASLANVASYSDLQGLEIKAKLSLTYTSTDEISNQYPKREDAELDEEIKGTWIGCNSSIASTVAATVGSPMTIYITEKTGETEENPKSLKLYYTRSSASAHLLYKSDDDDGKYSGYYYDQLGINASDLPEGVTDNQSPMNTLAVYDVSELLGVADTADYVELTISLYRKDAEGKYTVALNPADYITAPTFGNTATGTITAASSDTPSAGRIYTYTFNRAALQSNASVYSGGVYTIPINYSVKTAFSGSDQATHFYSNYIVVVSASMYKNEVENENTVPKMLNGTDDDDHLIYTNAKINSNAFD